MSENKNIILLTGDDVKQRIEPFLHYTVENRIYQVKTLNPVQLLTWNRFDIAAKLLFLDDFRNNRGVYTDIYEEHIRLFSLGSFQEPGNIDKNSISKFKDDFINLYASMADIGFDCNQSLIPLASDGTILNGSHRVACAIALQLPVRCVELKVTAVEYDYNFFRRRGASLSFLDQIAYSYIKTRKDTFIAVIWPSAKGHDTDIKKIIGEVIYYKEIYLNWNACRNLIAEIYKDELWLGSRTDNFPGATSKASPCFAVATPLRVYVFQNDSVDGANYIKKNIRSIFNIEKHSVHINDTHDQAIAIGELLLNDNSIHFLRYANPNKYLQTWIKLSRFKNKCIENKIKTEAVVLDGGLVLSLYGLRQSSDVDYIIDSCKKNNFIDELDMNNHNDQIVHHRKTINELIYDRRLYFIYSGLKFISFQQLARMKQNRREPKDITDWQIMKSFIEGRGINLLVLSLEQAARFRIIKYKIRLLEILRFIRIYKHVRFVYRKLKYLYKNFSVQNH
ncbi:MAG: hypothetical protein AB2L12_18200 [Smithellaceae bacterium]